MSECRGCGAGSGIIGWCRICRMVVPHITGNRPGLIENSESIEETRESLGYPDSRPYSVWSAIRKFKADDISWLWSDLGKGQISRLGGEPPTWEIDDEDIELIESRDIAEADPEIAVIKSKPFKDKSTARIKKMKKYKNTKEIIE